MATDNEEIDAILGPVVVRFKDCVTKEARIAFIREKLATDKSWAIRGLQAVYRNQTNDEQRGESVKHQNGVGFTVHDVKILTSIVKSYERRQQLSEKQWALLFRLMPKYARQLEQECRS